MRIVDYRKKCSMVRFEDIPVGDCFIDDDGNITIKVVCEGNRLETSAVCLQDGEQWFPLDHHEFEVVSASVVIE